MYCGKCGRNNPDNYRYCMGCGNDLTTGTSTGYQNGYQTGYQQQNQWNAQSDNNAQYGQQNGQYYSGSQYGQTQQNYPVNNGGDNKKKTIIALVCVAVVIYLAIMGVAGAYFVDKKDSDKSSKSSASRYDKDYDDEDEDEEDDEDIDEDEEDEDETTTKKATTKPVTTTQSNKDNYGNIKPDNYYDGSTFYVNDEAGLHLRKGPGTGYDSSTVLDYGEKVVVRGSYSNDYDWYYVYVESEGTYGWVYNAYLSRSRPSSSNSNTTYYIRYSSSFVQYVNTGEGLYLRERPSTNASYIALLPYQKSVEVLGYAVDDSSWYYVRTYLDGSYYYGYCYKYYLS